MSSNDELPIGYISLSNCEEINRCIYKIADPVSNMTIMLMENGDNGDIRIKDQLAKMIDVTPNKDMVRKTFIQQIVTDMCMSGNCTVYPYFTADGYISNLQILHNCSYLQSGDSYVIHHAGKVYNPADVLHFVLNPDSNYPFRGVGLLPLVRKTIENIAQANATKTGFLKSKWKPSLIISISADNDDLQDASTRNKVLKSYTDTTEDGEPWLIPAGEVDVKTVQPLTLNDLAIQDSLTLDIKTLACAFGIPPFLIGIGDFNRDAYNNFISTTVMSIATLIQQELTKKLLISDKRYFRLNPKSLLQYNLSEKMGFVKEMVGGGMFNRNEARNEFDYSPVDVEGMNDYVVLENYVPVGKVGDQKKLMQGDATTVPKNDNTDVGNSGGVNDGVLVSDDTSVAQVSLNGAQIQSLLEIVKAVVANQLDYDGAIALITSAFPFNKDIAVEIIGDPSKLSVDDGGDK